MTVAITLFQGLMSLRRSYTVLLVMLMLPGGMPVGHGLDLFERWHMKRSRLRFKYTLRHCRQNEQSIRANMHAKAYLEKDMV